MCKRSNRVMYSPDDVTQLPGPLLPLGFNDLRVAGVGRHARVGPRSPELFDVRRDPAVGKATVV